jgi:hypothetical protein
LQVFDFPRHRDPKCAEPFHGVAVHLSVVRSGCRAIAERRIERVHARLRLSSPHAFAGTSLSGGAPTGKHHRSRRAFPSLRGAIATQQSRAAFPPSRAALDCFAPLAMTSTIIPAPRFFDSRCEFSGPTSGLLASLFAIPGFRFAHPGYEKRREAERRQTQFTAATVAAARAQRRSAHAYRRSTAALAKETVGPRGATQAMLPETRPEPASLWTANRGESRKPLHGCYPRRPVTV